MRTFNQWFDDTLIHVTNVNGPLLQSVHCVSDNIKPLLT